MNKTQTFSFIGASFLAISIVIITIASKFLDNSMFFYGVYASLATVVIAWIFLVFAFDAKRKLKRGIT